jgi:dUTP pyrophosphatase
VKIYNHGKKIRVICPGEKIAQIVIVPCLTEEVEVVDQICGGERGDQGFGSTGRF